MVSKGRAAIAGVVAAGVALGVAEVVAAVSAPRFAPLIAVGGVVVDNVPEPAKQFAIRTFGENDKTALLVGTGILLAVFAALIGIGAARSRIWGYVGIGVFAAIGIASAVTRHEATWLASLPTAIGCAAAIPVLFRLLRFAEAESPAPSAAAVSSGSAFPGAASPGAASSGGSAPSGSGFAGGSATSGGVAGSGFAGGSATSGGAGFAADGRPITEVPAGRHRESDEIWQTTPGVDDDWRPRVPQAPRRGFLKWAAGLTGMAVLVGVAGRWLASRRTVELAQQSLQLPMASSPAGALPANIDPPVDGLAKFVTSNRDFYRVDTALMTPQVDPAGWTLRIHGKVANPFTITFDELLAMPMVERYITLCCVSNEVGGDLIGNARWLGVPVKMLLDRAQPMEGADQVVCKSVDGWTCGTPTAVLRDGRDALLAIGMNGDALPIEHGFPVRMVTPGLYGYVSACKWITDMEVTTFDAYDAYWIKRGWAQQAPIKTQSRIDAPRNNAEVSAGDVVIAGVAWAQHRGITTVEVSTDNGASWKPADLGGTVSADTWRQWTLRWQAAPGEYNIKVRAADATGAVQSETPVPIGPDGAEGWHTIKVTVRA